MGLNNEEKRILEAAKTFGISDRMLNEIKNGSQAHSKFLLKELKRELICRIIG